MEGYFGYSAKLETYLSSHFLEIVILALIGGIAFVVFLIIDSKRETDTIERPYSRELPEGWFSKLINIIATNAQKKEIIEKSYEIYDWVHNGFTLHLFLDWQDFNRDIEVFDLPILMSATVTIYRQKLFGKQEVFNAHLDRNNYLNTDKDYLTQYKLRKANNVSMRVSGREII